jgi:hypothetical protein
MATAVLGAAPTARVRLEFCCCCEAARRGHASQLRYQSPSGNEILTFREVCVNVQFHMAEADALRCTRRTSPMPAGSTPCRYNHAADRGRLLCSVGRHAHSPRGGAEVRPARRMPSGRTPTRGTPGRRGRSSVLMVRRSSTVGIPRRRHREGVRGRTPSRGRFRVSRSGDAYHWASSVTAPSLTKLLELPGDTGQRVNSF